MYCTIEDVRNAGAGGGLDDAVVAAAIRRACDKIDAWTRMRFLPTEKSYYFSGHGGKTLLLDLDIIVLDRVVIDGYVVDPEGIIVVQSGLALYRPGGWPRGEYNVLITGTFGRCTEQGEPPAQIHEAAIRLAERELVPIGDRDGQAEITRFGRIVSETTDGHSYSLAKPANVGEIGTFGYWTGDAAIDGVLVHFVAPTKIRAV